MKKKIAILGSTGSIGTQALNVCREHPEAFEPVVLTANHRVDLLIAQARQYHPEIVVIGDERHYAYLKEALADLPIKVYAGYEAIAQVVTSSEIDIVLTALVGFAGLVPTIEAIKAGKTIALANKETLVVAGDLITALATEYQTPILPVDSEHSAIFQCLQGQRGEVEKIILTASGGPFRNYTHEELQKVSVAQALKHPRWEMGSKITIDSATLMNKGLEVIEAKWLFGVQAAQIEVVVHPQSIIHSAVQFSDGAVIAQLGAPTMELPIQYAFSYPQRLSHSGERISLIELGALTFEQPDTRRFPCLQLAFDALTQGGNMPCILNAANEIANQAFLEERISFTRIPEIIHQVMQTATKLHASSLEEYIASDAEARRLASQLI